MLALLLKEFRVEYKEPYALTGLLLYLASVLMVVYVGLMEMQPQVWLTLYWIVALFIAINASAKSFMHEARGRWFYYYQLAHPVEVIISKIVYNTVLLVVLNVVCWLLYSLVLGSPVRNYSWLLTVIVLGSVSISILLTMMSAIASKAGNNATLMSVLSLPVLIPTMLLLVNLSMAALVEDLTVLPVGDLFILVGLDCVMLMLAFVLFPYLWKD
ncbi:MAG TPA: heme exporter protein CcmB [Chitinophagales bacterium]|nr:heme exporter protein CcmB [Chitinophagales bacterium]